MEEGVEKYDEMELAEKTLGERFKAYSMYAARLLGTVVLGGVSALAYCLLFVLAFSITVMFLPLVVFSIKYLILTIVIIVAGFVLMSYLSRVIVKIIKGNEVLAIILGLIYAFVTIFFVKALFLSTAPMFDSVRIHYNIFYNIVGVVYLLLLVVTFFKVLGKAFRGND